MTIQLPVLLPTCRPDSRSMLRGHLRKASTLRSESGRKQREDPAMGALPLDASLRGGAAYAQAFVVDPQGPFAGLAVSAGLKLVLGD